MHFLTPKNTQTHSLEVKKSQFIAYATPCDSKTALNTLLTQVTQKHPDARHICYGYVIGDPKNTTHSGFSDAGEPNGTAGRPILNVLLHKNIGNCAVFVVRYFGGIKLGAGGLCRAYSSACTSVLERLILTSFVPKIHLDVATSFKHEHSIRHHAQILGGQIIDTNYPKNSTYEVSLRISLDVKQKDAFVNATAAFACVTDA